MITKMVEMSLHGETSLEYSSRGLIWKLTCQLKNVLERTLPQACYLYRPARCIRCARSIMHCQTLTDLQRRHYDGLARASESNAHPLQGLPAIVTTIRGPQNRRVAWAGQCRRRGTPQVVQACL